MFMLLINKSGIIPLLMTQQNSEGNTTTREYASSYFWVVFYWRSMKKYKSLHRATLGDTGNIPHSGVYLIAYMGRVLYVGKASVSVFERLKTHLYKNSLLGVWMKNIDGDWNNVRLDVLETPDIENDKAWLNAVEDALIKKYSPLFNVHGMTAGAS